MANNIYSTGVSVLKKNTLPMVLLGLSLGLAVFLRQPLERFPAMVDWNTIVTLCGLLLITTGIKESGLFYLAAYRISRQIRNERLLALLDFSRPATLYFSGALMSQGISNVPSAILLTKYSSSFKIIAYGVNIGGNGLVIGSFANLIALRFIQRPGKNLLFHVYSIPYFLVTLVSVYYWMH